jgi:hypothetical protein
VNKSPSIALFFVAILVATTGAKGQNVYRCGNSYSQKPCTDGVVIDVQDARTPAQKADSDALARREAATANSLEKTRLKEESRQRAEPAKTAGTTKNGSSKPAENPAIPRHASLKQRRPAAPHPHRTRKNRIFHGPRRQAPVKSQCQQVKISLWSRRSAGGDGISPTAWPCLR